MSATIPVNEPFIGERELELVQDSVRSGWISSAGPYVNAFEEAWAAYCGRKHGVAVANGTLALQLAVACLDLQQGDEVILPTFTIISCATAILAAGATPVVVDADPETWCMDPDAVADVLTSRTRAIMPVHIYGHPVDMAPILELAAANGVAVVEDAAEAHGAEYASSDGWRRCGSFGELSCFSFYANKLITTGEGGMVLTDDDGLADRLRSLRNLAFGRAERFRHEALGFNFRLTNVQAAIGAAQLERMDAIVARKREAAARYTDRLRDVRGLELPTEREWARNVYWMYGVVVDEATGLDARRFAELLLEHGVETRPFFLGMHEQPVLRRRGLFAGERHPVSERLSRQGLYLPSGTALTDEQIDQVAIVVRKLLT